jgi:hypothetical protein
MLEKTVENYLRDKVKTMGGIALKVNASNMAGLPDRMILFPEGKIYFVELKAPGKKPRPLQLASHRILRGLGFRVYVIDTKEGVLDFLKEVATHGVQAT